MDDSARHDRGPVVEVATAGEADEGIATAIGLRVADDTPGAVASLDFGDGTVEVIGDVPPGGMTVAHVYASGGHFRVSARVSDRDGNTSEGSALVAVAPRRVVFVQGVDSSSSCPAGQGMAGHAPAWLPAAITAETWLGDRVSLDASDFRYLSYSGRYCDGGDGANGAAADYRGPETCSGIAGADGAAAMLKRLIDGVAPSKVTVLGHSLGGLVAAYLVGSDPDWARAHIASVLTFDSPLSGVPRMNLEVLALASLVGDACDRGSRSMRDMGDGDTTVMRTASRAAQTVPFYNFDATEREGPLWGVREAVPGDRTHLEGETLNLKVPVLHGEIWDGTVTEEGQWPTVRGAIACGLAAVPMEVCPTRAVVSRVVN